MNVSIIGNGDWGKAMYSVVSKNTNIQIIKREEKADFQEVVILAVPTQSIRSVLDTISFRGKTKIIINTAKGIEEGSHFLPNKIIREKFGKEVEYYTLIGPSFADEVKRKMPTIVNLGYKRKTKNTLEIKKILQTDYFRVRLTHGVEILELSAAFKNIYAIGCGLAKGIGYGLNTRVKLMVLAIEEQRILYKNLNLIFEPSIIAGTLGDLILTCSSTESRNFTFGTLISKHKVKIALKKITTIEGYYSLPSIEFFKKNSNSDLPLATFIADVVRDDDPRRARKKFKSFVKSI